MRPTISDLRTLGQLALSFRWNLEFTKFPNSVTPGIDTAGLNLRCETAALPKATMTTFDVNIRGHKVWYNGITTAGGELKFGFIETVGHEIVEFFKAWRDKSYDLITGQAQNKADLEGIITIYQLDNQDNAVYKYELNGVLMRDYEVGELTNDNAYLKPSITVQFDTFKQTKI